MHACSVAQTSLDFVILLPLYPNRKIMGMCHHTRLILFQCIQQDSLNKSFATYLPLFKDLASVFPVSTLSWLVTYHRSVLSFPESSSLPESYHPTFTSMWASKMMTTSAVAVSKPVLWACVRPRLFVCLMSFSGSGRFLLQSLIILSSRVFSFPTNQTRKHRGTEYWDAGILLCPATVCGQCHCKWAIPEPWLRRYITLAQCSPPFPFPTLSPPLHLSAWEMQTTSQECI